MSNSQLSRNSVLLLALMSFGFAAPVSAAQFDSISLERLRMAPGEQGIGFGALVVPSTSELGELNLNLYDDKDVAQYWVNASMSYYQPLSILPVGRMQFGGISGALRGLQIGSVPHPTFVGFVEGTWAMDGNGVGTISAVAFRIDGEGLRQPFGVITGEFEAVEIVVGQTEPATKDGLGQSTSMTYNYLAAMQKAQRQAAISPSFKFTAQRARDMVGVDDFGTRPADLELRIRAARRQAQAQDSGLSGPQGTGPSDVHLAAHVLAHYKFAD